MEANKFRQAILKAIQDILNKHPKSHYVTDEGIAESLGLELQLTRDYLELMQQDDYITITKTHDGWSAGLTAKGRLALTDPAFLQPELQSTVIEETKVLSLIAEGENGRIDFKRELDLKSGKEGERGEMEEQAKSIFIGHGRSPVWRELKDFLQDRLNLKWDEFKRQSVAGFTTKERLNEMLDQACFAFLIMTAEDEHVDQTKHARENVIHEAGLFQGRLGFEKAIILLEEGCTEFSNVQGIQQIRFPPGNIKAVFEDIRLVLEREKILPLDALERAKVPPRAVMLGPTPSTAKEMRQHRWEKLSLERIANDPGPLEKRYPGLPLGERQLNGVPFVLSTKYFSMHRMPAHVDIPVELRLDEPLERVGSVHVLIIGGNVYKQHQGTPLEGVTIGRIQLIFHDKSSQEPKKLIVGENIREWVPGNSPGDLVDIVTEQLCQVAWKGEDSSGKDIFIDHLEIPLQEHHRRKALERIHIFRDVQPGTPEGILSFSIFAITLECQ